MSHPVNTGGRHLTVLLLAALLLAVPLAVQADDSGKQAFVGAGCNRCHPVASQGVEAAKVRASDLSEVGGSRDDVWLRSYLTRDPGIEGMPHPVPWKGSDGDLAAIVAWLAALK